MAGDRNERARDCNLRHDGSGLTPLRYASARAGLAVIEPAVMEEPEPAQWRELIGSLALPREGVEAEATRRTAVWLDARPPRPGFAAQQLATHGQALGFAPCPGTARAPRSV